MPAFHDHRAMGPHGRHMDSRPLHRTVRQLMVQGTGQDARRRGFTHAANAGEDPGLVNASSLERVRDGTNHRLPANQVVKCDGRTRKMLLAMTRDCASFSLKLADRTHNMRTIEAMSPPRRRAIARETLEIYAPIAERLGLYRIKLELEGLGFWALYPQRYRASRTRGEARTRQPERIPQEDRAAAHRSSLENRDRSEGRHARKASLQHLQENAPQARDAERDRRRVRPAYRGELGRHLLSRASAAPPPPRAQRVSPDAGSVQGLHRHPAGEWLPVVAHHAVRAERRADRSADPHG